MPCAAGVGIPRTRIADLQRAQLRPGVGAHGEGDTPEAAVADLREALEGLIAEFGVPQELTITVDVA